MVRLGNDYDGGYILPEKIVKDSDGLLSFGYGYDCSFEQDYIKKSNNTVTIYDHTCDYFKLIKVFLKYLKRFLLFKKKLKDVKFHLKNLIRHHNFVRSKKINFFKKKIVDKEKEKNDISIKTVLENIKFKKAILKCDIEGTEYDILDELIQHNKIFDCILIEFHKIEENINNFKNLIKKLSQFYSIIHLHGNNHDPLLQGINLPSTLEITFIKKSFILEKKFVSKFPNKYLDNPNNPNFKDLEFEFKD
tara:strand:- start:4186 stop:4929 length:744 start_codon:yes stop_codon:yes gene_type:complete